MSLWRTIARAMLPARLREYLRGAHRDFVFRRAMKRFVRSPRDFAQAGSGVLKDLIYGWNNDAWSALDEYLAGAMDRALTTPGPTLECGSGLSTLLLGVIAQQRGLRHFALEHSPQWAARVRSHLERQHIGSVTVCSAPLKDHGEFSWYDVSLESLPDSFSLVLCDGPPSGTTKGGRYGLVPILRSRLKPGCVILLDDIAREEERTVAERWQTELQAMSRTCGTAKPYLELTIQGQ